MLVNKTLVVVVIKMTLVMLQQIKNLKSRKNMIRNMIKKMKNMKMNFNITFQES
jgi:uncharacterized protein YlxP (DUF503 family)